MSQCVWQKESTCLMFFCQYMLLSPSRDFSKTRNIYCFLQTVAQTLPGYSTVKNMPILVEKKKEQTQEHGVPWEESGRAI